MALKKNVVKIAEVLFGSVFYLMQQRFFNTSRWLQTRANNNISTFSHSGIFPLFPTFGSLQTFLNKICNHQTQCHHYNTILWKNYISWSKTLFSTLVDPFMRCFPRGWWGKGWIIKKSRPYVSRFFSWKQWFTYPVI